MSHEGELQASALARRLSGTKLAAIYTSPVHRARQTAGVLAERLRTTVEVTPALEEVDYGAWTGRAYADLADEPGWAVWNNHRATARAAGGEAMADAQARIVRFLEGTADRHNGVAFACVSHCDMIRAAVAHYLGLSLDRLLAFEVDPASVSRLIIGEWGGKLASLNEAVTP